MAVNLSPIWGAGAQLFDNSGNVLSGGKIYTYAAGTTTPAATYTSFNGITANSNPIILNSAGRVPYEIWLSDTLSYKFVLKDSNDTLIATYDNLVGINSNFIAYTAQQEIQTATAGQTVFNLTTMQYIPGTNNLSVFVDGVNQYGPGAQYAFVETDTDTVTFVNGLHVGASVKFTTASPVASSATNAVNVAYDPPFTGAVGTNVEAKLSETVSVKDFGAVGDGVTDDTAAIQAALDSGASGVFFPAGTYKTTDSILIDGKRTIYGEGMFPYGSTIVPDASVLEAVKIGSVSLFGGSISNLNINRGTYSGATENIGFALYDVANGLFETLYSHLNKYNFYIKPQDGQRVAYSQFINCTASQGYWNWAGALTGSGYSNENVLLGCRFITSANTNTQFRLNWDCNYWRLLGCSLEGTAAYGLYFNYDGGGANYSNSLYVENCRFEGTFSTARIYLGANAQYCTINQHDFYGTDGIVDDGKNNYIFDGFSTYFNRDISVRTNPVLTISDKYSSSGNANAIQVRSGRSTGKAVEVVDDGTDAVMGGLELVGNSVSYQTAQSAWNYYPLVLGTYYFWVDTSGRLRIKNGAPSSATDGTIVGTQS